MSVHATIKGIVENYLLNSAGEVNGLHLSDNRQLKVPPHLRKHLTQAVPVGSSVSAQVKPGQESEFGQAFHLHKWLNDHAVTHPSRLVQGQVKTWLVDKRGERRGFILEDGLQVHLPRHLRESISAQLKLGADVGVEGPGSQTPFGSVLKAEKILLGGVTFGKHGSAVA